MSFKLIAEINEGSILLRKLFDDFDVSSVEKLIERLDEAAGVSQAMGRAQEKDWVSNIAKDSSRGEVDQKKQNVANKILGKPTQIEPDVSHLILKNGLYYEVKMVGGQKLNLINIKSKEAANIDIAKVKQEYTPRKGAKDRIIWVQK